MFDTVRAWKMRAWMIGIAGAVGLFAGVATSGCDEADELVDCAEVCEKYEECVDSNFDVSECTDRCEDRADSLPNFAENLEQCDDCIEDRACAEATVCAPVCAGIVQ